MYEITITSGINSTATGYTVRMLIVGEFGERKAIEREIKGGGGVGRFYAKARVLNPNSCRQRIAKQVSFRAYQKLFNEA